MDIKLEFFIYILLAGILSAIRRIISGAKNGCFYGKNLEPKPKLLERYINNIHFLETPAWYSQFGFQTLLCLCIYRTFHIDQGVLGYFISVSSALMTAMGSSAMAGVFFQGFINVGSGQPFVDTAKKSDISESEFALLGTSIWWKRWWYGKNRIYAAIFGLITFLAGIYCGLYFQIT